MRERPADSQLEPLTLDGSGQLDMRATYADVSAGERPRLFEPAPAPMAGQPELFDPDAHSTETRADSPQERMSPMMNGHEARLATSRGYYTSARADGCWQVHYPSGNVRSTYYPHEREKAEREAARFNRRAY